MNRTTIIVEKSTRDKLKNLGKKGETYDNVINGLLIQTEKEAVV